MTTELIRVLSDLTTWVKDWNLRVVPTEEEFVDKLKELSNRLAEELPKQKNQEIQENQ